MDGTSSTSGTQCEPWIFPADDHNDYYTKFMGQCDVRGAPGHFRESELVAAGMGQLLHAPLPPAAAIWVPAILAAKVTFTSGHSIGEQWAVGTQEMPVIPAIQGVAFRNLVARSNPEDRVAIVAIHTWLGVQDHTPDGHNFFEHQPRGEVMSFDHCTALTGFFSGLPPAPVALNDPGNLLDGIPPGDVARLTIKHRVLAVDASEIAAIVAYFPTDPVYPWLDPARHPDLVKWIMDRKVEVANAIA